MGPLDISSATSNLPLSAVLNTLPKRQFFCGHSGFPEIHPGKSGVSCYVLGFPCTSFGLTLLVSLLPTEVSTIGESQKFTSDLLTTLFPLSPRTSTGVGQCSTSFSRKLGASLRRTLLLCSVIFFEAFSHLCWATSLIV